MPQGFLDRRRAGRLMAEQGLDALVLAAPESITYATGAFPGVASFWRRAGAAFVVVPSDADAPLTAIVGDLQADAFRAQSGIADVRTHPIWVETGIYDPPTDDRRDVSAILRDSDLARGKPERTARPGQYDLGKALELLRDALSERGLANARAGLELGFVPARDLPAFEMALPKVTWVDATHLVERLRAIKSPIEIDRLRKAAEFSVAGIRTLLRSIEPGMDPARMTEIWRNAALAEAARRKLPPPASNWAYIAVGGDGFAPGGPAQPGDLIKIDVGCVIEGYSSDCGRTAVLGAPSLPQRRVHDALRTAFEVGLGLLAPGARLAHVYRAVAQSMWASGFTTYGRGHFGHGVGASIWSEEWPFITAEATAIAEPGMVLAFETPYYIAGLGGFIIEDQVLVTDAGIEVMTALPCDLAEV